MQIDSGSWRDRLARDTRRVFVLDDDPTGTQTTSDIDVILIPGPDQYREFVRTAGAAVHVLTNTRALPREAATELIESIVADVTDVCASERVVPAFVLRGDSTLRGHVFAEVDAMGASDAVTLLVPALPEAGRVTIGGIHWLVEGGMIAPVSESEFAADPVFGYGAETITDWVAEVAPGRQAVTVPLDELRRHGPDAVSGALLEADDGTVVIPDAVDESDLRITAWGLLDAEQSGRDIVVRSAASFATTRYGGQGRDVSGDLMDPGATVLVVCGSHTMASTLQLKALSAQTGVEVVTLPTGACNQDALTELAAALHQDLAHRGLAILATERARRAEDDSLDDGASVMRALMTVTDAVIPAADVVITKGGITSAQTAVHAMGASKAHVLGQVLPGVPVWRVENNSRSGTLQIVVPGNVGTEGTLSTVLSFCRADVGGTDG